MTNNKETKLFPERPEVHPKIYVFSVPSANFNGIYKVGYTVRNSEERIKEEVEN